ncbi:hypothetical protein PoB_004858900 [Plakobranchus ocellatus]|uniref:Uncharacterized protein n=1 Tax=Plakobranchus ocellatus TaxID=259542 RepID=A0AAV4BPP8_9GAST|nr:hypothetical protein PoB_004858900 [Plakobranchus ocellatus]
MAGNSRSSSKLGLHSDLVLDLDIDEDLPKEPECSVSEGDQGVTDTVPVANLILQPSAEQNTAADCANPKCIRSDEPETDKVPADRPRGINSTCSESSQVDLKRVNTCVAGNSLDNTDSKTIDPLEQEGDHNSEFLTCDVGLKLSDEAGISSTKSCALGTLVDLGLDRFVGLDLDPLYLDQDAYVSSNTEAQETFQDSNNNNHTAFISPATFQSRRCESIDLSTSSAPASVPFTSKPVSHSYETRSPYESMKATVAFEIDFSADQNTNDLQEMPKKAKNSLQEAFLHFRKKRQVGQPLLSLSCQPTQLCCIH